MADAKRKVEEEGVPSIMRIPWQFIRLTIEKE